MGLGLLLIGIGDIAAPSESALSGMPEGALSASIDAQPLAEALAAFAQQSGLQLVYVSALAEHRRSRPVAAGLSPTAALTQLLAGTGLRFEFLSDRTVRILADASDATPMRERPDKESPGAKSALEEVLVTAEKREESLSVVPISANVLSSAEMDAAGIKGISGIAAVTPGVQYDYETQFGPGILTRLGIRGIASDIGAATTGVYIDDVPIQSRQSGFGNAYPVAFDLTRVEVLRGPQGTLFGSGAEGGAIRFITTEPSMTEFTGLYRAEVSQTEYSEGASFETGATVGGPIIDDRVGLRLSAWYRDGGGFVNRVNPFTGATIIVTPIARRPGHCAQPCSLPRQSRFASPHRSPRRQSSGWQVNFILWPARCTRRTSTK
jgi:outer membrane receptor protein involved in Fe transport